MDKLWGGRFTKNTDAQVFDFNASFSFDKRLLEVDVQGSLAHVAMLKKQGIVSAKEASLMTSGLKAVLKEAEKAGLENLTGFEDVHSFVEAKLIEKIGDTGKKLHTGRSRNDQVALDMKLYVRGQIDELRADTAGLMKVINGICEQNTDTLMPGFTHLQKAQPVTLAHHFGAYFEMFKRDLSRFQDIRKRMNTCPLGSGALAGTTYPLDREYTAELLGFDKATDNSMDSVADRDYLVELMAALSLVMMHLSRFCEEMIIWNSDEYRFIEIDDAFTTGSSIMPQKKNPDVAELIRGKTGRVYGSLFSLLTLMKGLPLAYNKDMQEDKEAAFDAIDTVKTCLKLFAGMLSGTEFRKDVMRASAASGFTNATDLADYLVGKGVPFRDAHGISGRAVLLCIDKGCTLEELTLDEYKGLSDKIEKDVYKAIALKTCVDKRNTKGAPGSAAVRKMVRDNKRFLERYEKTGGDHAGKI